MPIASALISNPVVDQHQVATTDDEPIEDVDPVAPNVDLVALDVDLVAPDVDLVALDVVMDIPLRRSERERSPRCSHGFTQQPLTPQTNTSITKHLNQE